MPLLPMRSGLGPGHSVVNKGSEDTKMLHFRKASQSDEAAKRADADTYKTHAVSELLQ